MSVDAENHSYTESSPKSKGATYCATAPDACTDSIIATTNRMATAYLASSHNTSTTSVLAASYSGAAALGRSLTTPFSDAHLTQLSAEDILLRPRLRRTRRTLQFRRAKISVHSCAPVAP